MKNRLRKLSFLVLAAAVVFCTFVSGCTKTGEGFAIYVTQESVAAWPPPATPQITGCPVITTSDIRSYDRNHHELTLTQSAFDRLTQLDVPIYGLGFAVCVNREVIYSGAFWRPISSASYNGPVILIPLDGQNATTVKIELGYPSSSFFQGQDPRSDPRILDALAGRLVG